MPKSSRKRKNDDGSKEIQRQIKRLEEKIRLAKRRRRSRIISSGSDPSDSDSDSSASHPQSSCTTEVPVPEASYLAAPSTSDPSTSAHPPSMSVPEEPVLDQEILDLLGDAPKIDTAFGKATHKDLALRWREILEKGLHKETKDKILQEYLIPENCDLLVAPTLNAEIKAALTDTMVKRDWSLMAKQKQLSIAIAAINQAIELLISKQNHTKIIKPISDACRLLCDSHHDNTKTRRAFVVSSINADMKETVSETRRDKYLFGENLAEKLKMAKSLKRSGTDLKPSRNIRSSVFNKNNFVKPPKNSNERRLNWKTLPWKTAPKHETGKPHPAERQAAAGSRSQQRETADQSAVRVFRRR